MLGINFKDRGTIPSRVTLRLKKVLYQKGVICAKLLQASQGLNITENDNFKRPVWGESV